MTQTLEDKHAATLMKLHMLARTVQNMLEEAQDGKDVVFYITQLADLSARAEKHVEASGLFLEADVQQQSAQVSAAAAHAETVKAFTQLCLQVDAAVVGSSQVNYAKTEALRSQLKTAWEYLQRLNNEKTA